jgi:hypothetical protein
MRQLEHQDAFAVLERGLHGRALHFVAFDRVPPKPDEQNQEVKHEFEELNDLAFRFLFLAGLRFDRILACVVLTVQSEGVSL